MNTIKSLSEAAKALLSVFVGGAATTLAAKFSDPTSIVFTHAGIVHMLSIGASGGLVSLFFYLKDFKPKGN